MIFVGYTTHYRGGSEKFRRAAETLVEEKRRAHPDREVRLHPFETKRDFTDAIAAVARDGRTIHELHFLGHSGMYGIMFGSTAWPEQLSPHEWRTLSIPFGAGATAYFHACRTARWFAPFFARTFGVRTFGHYGYTTVSTLASRFSFEGFRLRRGGPIYLVSVPGRKTHGLSGAVRKYAFRPAAVPMKAIEPSAIDGEASYDAVAELYDRAFSDIRVRRDEWRWLTRALDARIAPAARAARAARPCVLDIGCGNGALLRALHDRISAGVGVDASRGMIDRANAHAESANAHALRFTALDGPTLPFEDDSFDVVVSFLSFRYLDWDPIVAEIRRVLRPGGSLLVVDMVEKPLELRDAAVLARSAANHFLRPIRDPRFVRDVHALTSHPAWKTMLEHNPIRAEHEYRFYFESRFRGRRLETLNVGRTQRLVAFDTGPLEKGDVAPLSYP